MNKTYKGFFITETAYHWGYEVVAIPQGYGETLRLKMIDYTKTERLQAMKDMVSQYILEHTF